MKERIIPSPINSREPTQVALDKAKSHEAQATNQIKVQSIENMAPILEQLEILANSIWSRELQQKTYRELKESLIKGEKSGTIKLPTGTGKTRVFANILMALQKNGLTLVPRVDLYPSTIRDFKSVGFKDHEIKLLEDESGNNSTDKMLAILTDPNTDWSTGRIQCIMTYQALTALAKKSPEMGEFMRSHFDIIIEDEAHRGLGKKTKKATGTLTEDDGDEIPEDADEMSKEITELEAETILGIVDDKKSTTRYHYKFTATPDLLGKSVTEYGEYITYATVEEAVRTWAILLPQYVDMGAAYTRNAELASWKAADIDSLAEGDNFVDENGKSIREKIIDAYIEKKQEHRSLPAVAFTSTIEHARQIVALMNDRGIRATRVTSGAGDISSSRATELMDNGELDVIVTVTKVSEWFDYPPLACAIWFTPSLSPAKILQGNGRIMRDTELKRPYQILDAEGKLVPSPNSYIIAPSVWYGGASVPRNSDGGDLDPEDDEDETPDDDEVTPKKSGKWKLPRIGNFYELLIGQNELNINSLSGDMRGIIDLNASIVYEVGEEVEIDGVVYVGVTGLSESMGVKGQRILSNAKKQGIQILHGKQKNGRPVQLVPESFIEGLVVVYECEVGEKIEIEGVVYIGVVPWSFSQWLPWSMILKRAETNNIDIKKWNQKNRFSINLVPKKFIDSLNKEIVCDISEEKIIDGVVYMGVSNKATILWIKWKVILHHYSKWNSNPIIARQNTWLWKWQAIQLIPKIFIEWLKKEYICSIGEEIMINWICHVGTVTGGKWLKVMGVDCSYLHKKAIERKIDRIKWKQPSGLSISLTPKSFIQEILKLQSRPLCSAWDEIEVDWVNYLWVTANKEWKLIMGIRWEEILSKLDANLGVISWVQKNGFSIQLVPKSFIEELQKKYK